MKSVVQDHSSSISKYFVMRVFLGVMLMFISAQVQIPLNPVPITLHTVGTLIIALTFTRAEAISTLSLYLLIGVLGLPVFSSFSGGIGVLMRGTGGYLIGMLFCVFIVTTLRQKFGEKSMMHLLAYSIIGSITIYAFGVPWLAHFIGFEKAIQFGLLPFIIPGCVKALFTASTFRLFKQKPWISKK